MNIAIDLRSLQDGNKYRGIGKSLTSLLGALAHIDHTNDYYFIVENYGLNPVDLIPVSRDFKYHVIYIKPLMSSKVKYVRAFSSLYRRVNTRGHKIDILLQPNIFYGVSSSVPTLAILYDLIPLLFQEEHFVNNKVFSRKGLVQLINPARSFKAYLKAIGEYKKASGILSISQSSKKDLLKKFPEIKENMVRVIGLGVNNPKINARSSEKNIRKELGISKKYLLYIGGIEHRKNISRIISDYNELRRSGIELQLVLVGYDFEKSQLQKNQPISRMMHRSAYRSDIVPLGYLTDDQVDQLYRDAEIFLFPSLYEGFGLPVLEAMARGCPVVTYNNSSIGEVAGDAAVLLEDNSSMVDSIISILSDSKFRKDLVKKGYVRASQFSWETTAKETLNFMQEIIGHENIS